MSGLLAGKVWASDLPPTLKPIAASLADIANEDGTSIHPSVAYLCWRVGDAERTVRRHLGALRDAGVLVPVCHPECIDDPGRIHNAGDPLHYRMVEASLPARPPWSEARRGAKLAGPFGDGVPNEARRGAKHDIEGVPLVAPDPSSDPSSDPDPIDPARAGQALVVYTELASSLGVMSPPIGWAEDWLKTRTVEEIRRAIGRAREAGARRTAYVDAILEKEPDRGHRAAGTRGVRSAGADGRTAGGGGARAGGAAGGRPFGTGDSARLDLSGWKPAAE